MNKIKTLLVANRGEIAIRVMRAASELGIRTVGIYANEDRFALHRLKADESYLVGEGKKPIAAYLDIPDIMRIAREAGVDAIHPGYGFLSENPEFAEACARDGICFIGPTAEVMRTLGNKVAARTAAMAAGVPVIPASQALPNEPDEQLRIAAEIGYPVMLKASWGGGGRGMRAIESADQLLEQVAAGRREALAAFGNDEVYLEKLIRRARHVEVQVLGDLHGQLVHLFERDCSVQRRNQKVVERAPAPYLEDPQRQALCASALKLCHRVGYTHAGTVEFLYDVDSAQYYFIEVNPRIQVEHTVTEEVTGIDIVKAQIRVSQGARIGDAASGVPAQEDIRLQAHALQCRVTTEDPEKGFAPDYGRISAYRSAAGFGVRLDGGTAYSGAVITPFFDSLLVKVTTRGQTAAEAIQRMDRALREFRIRGVATNLQFLENVIRHPSFADGSCTTKFLDNTPELFRLAPRRDRATRLLRFLGDVTVNGNPEMKGRKAPEHAIPAAHKPAYGGHGELPAGTRDRLRTLGPKGFATWMREQPQVLLTDTSMRDAHQSLFATRMRTRDMVDIAPYYARLLPQLLSVECWGGATFDVALRFLKEDPWDRLRRLRAAMPNLPLQMLLRSANAVGYTNYPDNVVQFFIRQAALAGVDIFRVFDSLNWVENMRVAMDAVIESGAVCEGTICYSGDLFDSSRPKFGLKAYVSMAKELERAGAHVLGIKDMAGICRPRAISELVRVLREETSLPIHFHTHDTSGIAAASVLAAIEAGVDAVDGALDALSGLTSQPNLTAIADALAGTARCPAVNTAAMRDLSTYWEGVRRHYAPFEADMRAGTSEVYGHEMPGGQVTNLREQARSLGIAHRWPEIAKAYADVNQLFGDIVKVTPTSKVVGDMALFMVMNGLSPQDVLDPTRDIAFPDSVVSLFRGELGRPTDGFPPELAAKVLQGEPPLPGRPGLGLAPADLEEERSHASKIAGHHASDQELASYLMYPKVFADFHAHLRQYGDVSVLPTSTFFNGLKAGDELAVRIDAGKTLAIRLQGISTAEDADQTQELFFEVNGQPRLLRVERAGKQASTRDRAKAEPGNSSHVGAPMPGLVASVAVRVGQRVRRGDTLLCIESMKMESSVCAERDGCVSELLVATGQMVAAKELLIRLED